MNKEEKKIQKTEVAKILKQNLKPNQYRTANGLLSKWIKADNDLKEAKKYLKEAKEEITKLKVKINE